MPVLIDDRALDPRAIEMLAALMVQKSGDEPDSRPAPGRAAGSARSVL
jgi:hypothetical protein